MCVAFWGAVFCGVSRCGGQAAGAKRAGQSSPNSPQIHSPEATRARAPAARLVEALGDKVRGEVGLEELPVLERVVQLAVRHRARLEPAVKDVVCIYDGCCVGCVVGCVALCWLCCIVLGSWCLFGVRRCLCVVWRAVLARAGGARRGARHKRGRERREKAGRPAPRSPTRRSSPLPMDEGIVMSSMKWRCRSVTLRPDSASSSSMEPITLTSSPSSDIQIGIGVPQKLLFWLCCCFGYVVRRWFCVRVVLERAGARACGRVALRCAGAGRRRSRAARTRLHDSAAAHTSRAPRRLQQTANKLQHCRSAPAARHRPVARAPSPNTRHTTTLHPANYKTNYKHKAHRLRDTAQSCAPSSQLWKRLSFT